MKNSHLRLRNILSCIVQQILKIYPPAASKETILVSSPTTQAYSHYTPQVHTVYALPVLTILAILFLSVSAAPEFAAALTRSDGVDGDRKTNKKTM